MIQVRESGFPNVSVFYLPKVSDSEASWVNGQSCINQEYSLFFVLVCCSRSSRCSWIQVVRSWHLNVDPLLLLTRSVWNQIFFVLGVSCLFLRTFFTTFFIQNTMKTLLAQFPMMTWPLARLRGIFLIMCGPILKSADSILVIYYFFCFLLQGKTYFVIKCLTSRFVGSLAIQGLGIALGKENLGGSKIQSRSKSQESEL